MFSYEYKLIIIQSAKEYFDAEKTRETDSADFSSAQSFFGNLRMGRKKVKGSSRERRSASATTVS